MRPAISDRDPGDETRSPLDVLCWRQEELERAGYPTAEAVLIAESNADLHCACELLRNGATVKQALRILL